MAPKKKGRAKAKEDEEPDTTALELKSIITNEAKRRDKEERKAKQALLPLKRINSNPMIFEKLPPARCIYPGSRSVDFGFDGVVDIPNQSIYIEEVPKTVLNKKAITIPGREGEKVTDTDFIHAPGIDDDDMDALTKMKGHGMMHFLKRRVKAVDLENFYDAVKSPYDDLPHQEEKRKCGCCCIFITILLILVLAAAVLGLSYLGLFKIPILTDLLLNLTSSPATDITDSTDTDSSIDPFAITGDGFDSGQLNMVQDEMAIIIAFMTHLDGKPVDISLKYEWPPEKETTLKIEEMVIGVYKHLGFVMEAVSVDDIRALKWGAWKIQVRVFARAKYNQDLMMWFGFNQDSTKRGSEYLLRMDQYFQETFLSLYSTTMSTYTSYFGRTFIDAAQRYYGKVSARRPPAHIPDNWGYCDGTPGCP